MLLSDNAKETIAKIDSMSVEELVEIIRKCTECALGMRSITECGRDEAGSFDVWHDAMLNSDKPYLTNLKCCPCCGAKAELQFQLESDQKAGYWVECVDCGLRTDGGYIAELEVQRWNQRVNEMEDCTMNAKQAKKMRHNEKLAYIAAFEKWLSQEPPKWKIWAWKRWKSERPHE